jgi:hypothetical protein
MMRDRRRRGFRLVDTEDGPVDGRLADDRSEGHAQ